jgi:hypothetical protein
MLQEKATVADFWRAVKAGCTTGLAIANHLGPRFQGPIDLLDRFLSSPNRFEVPLDVDLVAACLAANRIDEPGSHVRFG